MTLVTRYLLVSRVEKETNMDLKSSSLGRDRTSGLYNLVKLPERYAFTTPPSVWCPSLPDILCCRGVMFAFKESDMKSVKRFPSQRKSSESVK